MKTKDVEVGGKYLCRVGDRIATVVVIHRITGNIRPGSGRKEPDTFRVRRLGTQVDLPSARSAAALRPIPPGPEYDPNKNTIRKIETSSTYGKTGQWLRTCQECGHKILTNPPSNPPTNAYLNQTCGYCHSSALDFGSEFQKTATPVIGAVQVSSPEELESLSYPASFSDGGLCAYCNNRPATQGKYCTECYERGQQELQPPAVPPTEPNPVKTGIIVSQDFYLSAAENHIGWCTTCKTFRGEDLEPDSRECTCPECHQPTLYGAELALSTGLVNPQEDE